jgi:hypothetical protein
MAHRNKTYQSTIHISGMNRYRYICKNHSQMSRGLWTRCIQSKYETFVVGWLEPIPSCKLGFNREYADMILSWSSVLSWEGEKCFVYVLLRPGEALLIQCVEPDWWRRNYGMEWMSNVTWSLRYDTRTCYIVEDEMITTACVLGYLFHEDDKLPNIKSIGFYKT